ncbi:hypothetical protein AKJ09_02134 [Labilithrix luteola]|uniref:Transporter n=1 Tax=Labilithrix luteola TaxID=1391654 RepID=A0A0K1PPJ8_9BACT|nr:transporter [Labilithrix luteola]AKU95470.1 hypothetical protein AKJ09_02134 [Labilithrix luteola]
MSRVRLSTRAALLVVGLAAALTHSARVDACATCGCGDPTLTAMGAEKPFRDRLRVSLDARHRTDDIGEPGVDEIRLRETRLDAQLAWAPSDRLFLMGTFPALHRTIRYVNEGETRTTAMGDVELRAKAFVATDRDFAPRHLYAITAGLKIPTAPRQRSETDGTYLPIEAQPGTGSWDPLLGMSYAFFARPWSFYASVQGSMPLRGTSEFRASPSLRTTTSAQYQLSSALALRLGVDTRLDARSYEDGRPERDSSGFIGFVSPEVIVSPLMDLLVVVSVRLPVVQALAGYHHEGAVLGLGFAYDF